MILAPSLVRDLQLNRLLLKTDTRTLAGHWIADHIPQGTAIAVTPPWSPYGKLQLGPAGCKLVPMQDLAALRAKDVFWVIADSLPPIFWSPRPSDAALAELNSGATLMFDLNPVRKGAPAPVFDEEDAFYAPIQHISSMERPGPRIRIWRLNPM